MAERYISVYRQLIDRSMSRTVGVSLDRAATEPGG
jgi:hypothetical protein